MTMDSLQLGSQEEVVDVPEGMVAYLVHLIWMDTRQWDSRRRLTCEQALDFADALAARLPAETRSRLEAIRSRDAAA